MLQRLSLFVSILIPSCLFYTNSFSQKKLSYQQSLGLGGVAAHQYGAVYAMYEAKVNYACSPTSSLSLNFRPYLGPGFSNNFRTKPLTDSLYDRRHPYINFVIGSIGLISYNFGNAATRKNLKGFGGAIGIGYGISAGERLLDTDLKGKYSKVQINGIVLDAKFNFPVGQTSWTLSSSYMFNIPQYNPDISGALHVNLLYNIGDGIRQKHRQRQKNYRFISK